jgi:hypothetical protein
MTTKVFLGSALSLLLAVSTPSVFADKGKGGGHGRGHGHGAKQKFDDHDRDDDRDVRRVGFRTGVRDTRVVSLSRRPVVGVRRPTLVRERTFFTVDRSGMRFRGLDTNRDGIVTRREWRGNNNSFRVHDTNGDGILSGAEVHLYRRRR